MLIAGVYSNIYFIVEIRFFVIGLKISTIQFYCPYHRWLDANEMHTHRFDCAWVGNAPRWNGKRASNQIKIVINTRFNRWIWMSFLLGGQVKLKIRWEKPGQIDSFWSPQAKREQSMDKENFHKFSPVPFLVRTVAWCEINISITSWLKDVRKLQLKQNEKVATFWKVVDSFR